MRPATRADRPQVVRTLTRAFADDPLLRWFFPDDGTWDERASHLFGYFFDSRVEVSRVTVSADVVAAALWSLPRDAAAADDRWALQVQPHLAADELGRLAMFGTVREALCLDPMFWYLGVLGVHPDWQRRGFGTAVLRPVLVEADAVGIPTWLETATEADVAFYRTLGYGVSGEVDVPDGGPHVWAMVRPPAEPESPHFEGV
jgi:GNAT superfamily N-acetyltransferase